MKKLFYINLIIIFLLGSCSKNIRTLSFNGIDTLIFTLPDSNLTEIYYYDIYKEKDSNYIMCYFNYVPNIYLFNLDSKTFIKKIPINKYFDNNIRFQHIDKDSIWIYGGSTMKFNSDSALMVINDRGEIKHIYSLENSKIINTKNFPLFLPAMDTFKSDAFDTCISLNSSGEYLIKNGKIFFNCWYSEKVQNNIYQFKEKYPLFAYFDIKSGKLVTNNYLWFRFSNNKYNREYYYTYISNSNKPIISFKYASYAYVLCDSDNITVNCMSKLFKNNYLDENEAKNQRGYFGFGPLIYCKKYNSYIRYFYPDQTKYPNTNIIITYDNNLNYIGEAVNDIQKNAAMFSNESWYNFEIKGKKLFLYKKELKWINTNLNKENTILNKIKENALRKFENERCKIKQENTNNTYQSQNILTYLKQFNVNNHDLCITILHKDGCTSCNNQVLDFIKLNQKIFLNSKSFYVFYINPNATINESLNFFEINSINTTNNCKTDTTNMYQFADPYSYQNPRLILIKDNKIVFDTIYLPSDIEKYFEKVVEFYN